MENPVHVGLLFTFIGLLFVALGFPLKQGAVPPNYWYGFRTRKTLSDKEIWYAINRVTGIDMIRVGIILGVASTVMISLRNWLSLEAIAMILTAVMLLSVAYMAIHGFSLLRRM